MQLKIFKKVYFFSFLKISNFLKNMDTPEIFCYFEKHSIYILSCLKIKGLFINKYWYRDTLIEIYFAGNDSGLIFLDIYLHSDTIFFALSTAKQST